MISFNIFDKIEEILTDYDFTFDNYNNYKVIFEKEVYDEWEREILELFNDIDTKKNYNNHDNCNFFSNQIVLINNTPLQQQNNNSNQTQKYLNKNEKEQIIKQLYKQIAIKSHPDKVQNQEKNILFQKGKLFYENKILIGVIYVAKKLLIQIDVKKYSSNIINNILLEIGLVKKKIKIMKGSLFWQWRSEINNINKYKFKEEYAKNNKLRKKID